MQLDGMYMQHEMECCVVRVKFDATKPRGEGYEYTHYFSNSNIMLHLCMMMLLL